jgi:Lon protease-like protein
LLAIVRAPPGADLPRDPTYLSWALAALAPLTLAERQALLEAEDSDSRLRMVTDVLRGELRTMRVLPSLPATEVARTRWSPN